MAISFPAMAVMGAEVVQVLAMARGWLLLSPWELGQHRSSTSNLLLETAPRPTTRCSTPPRSAR